MKACTKFNSKPPNSNMVFLSRFKSHRPKLLTAFLPQQPTLVLTPARRSFDLRGPIAGIEGGLKWAFASESPNHTVLHPKKIQKTF
jgi:hypothetical protein